MRAYFDARAPTFDRLYDHGPGLRGRLDDWVVGSLRSTLETTLAELGDLRTKTLLDIGCGPGRYAVAAAERGAHVVGIDLSSRMLALARHRARDRGVSDRCRFLEADFDTYQPDTCFDVVLMISFIEYRVNPFLDLARLRALTIEKAIVKIPLPYRWQTIARRVRHRLRNSPPSFHVHSPAAIAACLEDIGFDSRQSDRGLFVAYPHQKR
ncbi:MAG: class I SAM-dependent methyltransferase [Gaiellaceae bacterium]